jgi:fermentation-respiration switch protein FrsA (DUF1100 family)
VLLENTFTSIAEMADHIFPWLHYVKHLLLRMYWPSIERIPKVRIPMLFVVGTNDEIVPASHTGRLHNAAVLAPFKQIHQVQGGTHNDTWLRGGKDYIYALKDFIEKAQERKKQPPTLGVPVQRKQVGGEFN